MESGDLPLESLLARFEEGTRLVKTCQAKLEEAAKKLENRVIYNTGDIKEMRAYMYRMMGIAAAVQVFIGIFLGLISFFHH